MIDPVVYLLVPVHNRRDITVQFAQAIATQTYSNLVFVLIDDGSTDGTAEAVRGIVPDVKVLRGDGGLWWAGGLQKGLDYIRSTNADDESIVLMCNDDVILNADFVQTGVDLLKSRPGSLLLAQHRETANDEPRETGVCFDDLRIRYEVASDPKDINCLSTRGLFLTWKTAQVVGGFHTRILSHYGSDYEWTIRAGRKGFALWTDAALSLVPMPGETGHRASGTPTISGLMTLYFSKRSTSNVVMRTVLYALTASRRHVPLVLLRYWFACLKQLLSALVRQVRPHCNNQANGTGPNNKPKKITDTLIAVPMIGNNNWLGGENYIRNILHALSTLPPSEQPQVRLTSAFHANEEAIQSLTAYDFVELHPLIQFARINALTRLAFRVVNRALRQLVGGDYNIEYRKIDLVYPVMSHAPGSRRSIYWIGDFQEIFLPHLFSKDQLKSRHDKNTRIIKSDNVLVLSSESALDDLKANFTDVNAEIHIWRFCSLPHEQAQGGRDPHQTYGLPEKYIYIPNQFWAHKNHEIAFRALGRIKADYPDIKIVCTGSTFEHRIKGHIEKLEKIIAEEGIADRLMLLGVVPRADQIEIMRHAAFILQPSLFEGWSTVVEDTRTLGRPILLSNLPVHLEQAPPIVSYFDPHDVEDLAQKMVEAWNRWPAGPDPEGEKISVALAEKRLVEAGREFVGILKAAMKLKSG